MIAAGFAHGFCGIEDSHGKRSRVGSWLADVQ